MQQNRVIHFQDLTGTEPSQRCTWAVRRSQLVVPGQGNAPKHANIASWCKSPMKWVSGHQPNSATSITADAYWHSSGRSQPRNEARWINQGGCVSPYLSGWLLSFKHPASCCVSGSNNTQVRAPGVKQTLPVWNLHTSCKAETRVRPCPTTALHRQGGDQNSPCLHPFPSALQANVSTQAVENRIGKSLFWKSWKISCKWHNGDEVGWFICINKSPGSKVLSSVPPQVPASPPQWAPTCEHPQT